MKRVVIAAGLAGMLLSGCGLNGPSADGVATEARVLCAPSGVQAITPIAGAWGKTHGLVIVCRSGAVWAAK